jgi:hypothetical protein
MRLLLHLLIFIPYRQKIKINNVADWFLDLPFYLIELVGIYEVYLLVRFLIYPKLRPLNLEEKIIIQEVFPYKLNMDLMWINEHDRLFTKHFAHAYVVGNIINYNEKITEKVFVHECVHVCQYQTFGLVYISRALRAQFSKEGYDYGGLYGVSRALAVGKKYIDFNFEQQAQIVEDFYEVKNRPDLLINPLAVNTYQLLSNQMLDTFKTNDK